MNPKGNIATLGAPWPKGVSGNPGGRNKMDPVLKKKLRNMTPEMFDRLQVIALQDESLASAVAAIKLLLAYAWGSPESLLENDDESPEGTSPDLTVEERRALARLALSTERRGDPDPEAN